MGFTTSNLSLYHTFSKTPVDSNTNSAAAQLGNAINKSGHTVQSNEIWTESIPFFGLAATTTAIHNKFSATAKVNDLVKDSDGKIWQKNSTAYSTSAEFADLWSEKTKSITSFTKGADGKYTFTEADGALVDGSYLLNSEGVPTVKYYEKRLLTRLTADNNANTNSDNKASRLQIDGKWIDQFIGVTDIYVNGSAAVSYAPVLRKTASDSPMQAGPGKGYMDYCATGLILWESSAAGTEVIDCFEYVGAKLDATVAKLSAAVFGSGTPGGEDISLSEQVTANTAAINVLNGADTIEGSIAHSIKTAIDAIPEVQDATTDVAGVVTISDNNAIETTETSTAAATVAAVAATRDAIAGEMGALSITVKAAQDTADEAKGIAETAIQKVTVNGTESSGTTVSITALTAVDTSIAGSNGITIGETSDKKVTLSVTPATYTSATKTWTNESNVAKASDIATAISDAVNAITIPSVTTSTAAQTVGVTASGHEVSVSTAAYTKAEYDENGKVTTQGSWTDATKNYLVTGDVVRNFVDDETAKALDEAKAYSDSLHSTNLVYVVLGDGESLPEASANTVGKIYLVAKANVPAVDGSALSGDYVEYMTRKVSETEYTWEKIGTTAADLTAYAKTADLNATDIGGGAVKVSQTNGVVSSVTVATEALVTDGAINASVADANALVKAGDALEAIKLAKPDNYVASVTGYTDKGAEVTTTQGAAVKVLDGRGTSVTADDLWGTKATLDAEGNLTITHDWITNPNTSIGEAWNSSITKVEDNKAYVGDTMWANVQTERIKDGHCMFYNTNLSQFSSDLSSLTNGEHMFSSCSFTSFNSDLSSLTNGEHMFSSCSQLTSFTSDLSSLTNGKSMFGGCSQLTSFTADLSSLTNGKSMFSSCSQLTSFTADLSSLTNGEIMFYHTNLSEFSSDLPSLTNGNGMFGGCSQLTSFTADLSSLTNGNGMFGECSQLTSFTADLSSLTNGEYMFGECKIDTESVEIIADTINDVTGLELSDEVTKRIDIKIGNDTPNDEEDAAFKQMQDKGWSVYVNGSDTEYVPRTGESSLDETGETTVAPKPYWAKPIEVTEDKAEYVGQDGKFYQVVGGQFIYVNDPDTYGMFVSLEDAIANMKLTKYVKPVEEEI